MKRYTIEPDRNPKPQKRYTGGPLSVPSTPKSFKHPADPPHSQMPEESSSDCEPECPTASCGTEVKRLQVKKEGPNIGKYFYACSCTGKGSAFAWETKVQPGMVIKCKIDASFGYGCKVKTERELEVDTRIECLECELIDLRNRLENLLAELSV